MGEIKLGSIWIPRPGRTRRTMAPARRVYRIEPGRVYVEHLQADGTYRRAEGWWDPDVLVERHDPYEWRAGDA